jgi:hypothetical protein
VLDLSQPRCDAMRRDVFADNPSTCWGIKDDKKLEHSSCSTERQI